MKPIVCNWLTRPFVTPCGKPIVGTIGKAGYCSDHIIKAAMFGKVTWIVKEEMFESSAVRQSVKDNI